MEEKIRGLFSENIETAISLVDEISPIIVNAGNKIVNCMLNDGKIFMCGNGASSANCMHFASAMLDSFAIERPPLPAIVLPTDNSNMNGTSSYARQLQALACDKDILIIVTTSGNANALINVLSAAHDKGMDVIALSGRDGGVLHSHLGPEDIEIIVPSNNAARIRELHLFILHCFCDLIDQALFGLG